MKPDLKDLDSRFVPWAADRAAKVATALAVRRNRARTTLEGVSLRDLKGLDERFASRGPLALLREVPQLGFVVIAAVFLVGAGTAVSQESKNNRAAQTVDRGATGTTSGGGEQQPAASTDVLGPTVGSSVRAYLATAAGGLQTAAGGKSKDDRLALVSLTDYRTPAQLQALLKGVDVRRVYLRVKAAGPTAVPLPIEIKNDLAAELAAAYRTNADRRRLAQTEFQKYVNTIDVTTPAEQTFKNDFIAAARSAGIEAQAFSTGCPCVYAVLVEAAPSVLRQLGARPGVRGVEVAAGGTKIREVQVLTLLPETTTTVPAAQANPTDQ